MVGQDISSKTRKLLTCLCLFHWPILRRLGWKKYWGPNCLQLSFHKMKLLLSPPSTPSSTAFQSDKRQKCGQGTRTTHQSHYIWILQSSNKGNHGSAFGHYHFVFIIHYTLFCVWLIPLNILILRFIHYVILHVSVLILFYWWIVPLYVHATFYFSIYLSIDIWIVRVLTIRNKATINICT